MYIYSIESERKEKKAKSDVISSTSNKYDSNDNNNNNGLIDNGEVFLFFHSTGNLFLYFRQMCDY